jgi:hypothetical protein
MSFLLSASEIVFGSRSASFLAGFLSAFGAAFSSSLAATKLTFGAARLKPGWPKLTLDMPYLLEDDFFAIHNFYSKLTITQSEQGVCATTAKLIRQLSFLLFYSY